MKFTLPGLSEKPLRLPRLQPYTPRPGDPAIFRFNSERDHIIADVVQRVVRRHSRDRAALELVLNDTAIHEIPRLERQRDAEAAEALPQWRAMVRRIAKMDDGEKEQAAERIARRMAEDVAGNFDPRVYALARQAVPRMLVSVLRPSSLPAVFAPGGDAMLESLLRVEGDVARLRRMQPKGALVYVPTHSSNLDSVVLGRALEQVGLSPVVYGAGKNLFSNPIISFFMHNLGAYRVDRRIKASLYKEILKVYSQVMIERGYHSLFFPGGTRSRSNLIENRLKLGLAGSAMSAFANNQVNGVERRVWFVPTTINYELVLEGESLVEDWLQSEGRARYIIEDDEFNRIDRWFAFLRKVVRLRSACVIRFGDPIDPFGNSVDEEGNSLNPRGDVIDPGTYVRRGGEAVLDAGRDAAYTRELGEVLVKRFRSDTVLMATSLVAHALYRRLVRETPSLDLWARLRLRGEVAMKREQLQAEVGEMRDRLCELQRSEVVRVNDELVALPPDEIVGRAIAVWNGYHSRVAARTTGTDISAEDPTLLLYYQNRMATFGTLLADERDLPAAREIAASVGVIAARMA